MYINLESNYECDDTLFLLYKWSKNIALLNKKNWAWKCMKLMSTIKGIDNELAISDVIPSYSHEEQYTVLHLMNGNINHINAQVQILNLEAS